MKGCWEQAVAMNPVSGLWTPEIVSTLGNGVTQPQPQDQEHDKVSAAATSMKHRFQGKTKRYPGPLQEDRGTAQRRCSLRGPGLDSRRKP